MWTSRAAHGETRCDARCDAQYVTVDLYALSFMHVKSDPTWTHLLAASSVWTFHHCIVHLFLQGVCISISLFQTVLCNAPVQCTAQWSHWGSSLTYMNSNLCLLFLALIKFFKPSLFLLRLKMNLMAYRFAASSKTDVHKGAAPVIQKQSVPKPSSLNRFKCDEGRQKDSIYSYPFDDPSESMEVIRLEKH